MVDMANCTTRIILVTAPLSLEKKANRASRKPTLSKNRHADAMYASARSSSLPPRWDTADEARAMDAPSLENSPLLRPG
eukprot:CAMPEP_0175844442 /NCGR_PEP_ID=MMETSP0107_2-20121207/21645_1 /TAXON_ID=195067 ORGANISM="Goniomonas pacifica, Strain CCMP1869" /NCGR_SAMPLE_ID=MMETSP0107_2 /ASSEMBLY_ACC=CAM_ASM_000203 /LENGTH=78 /DNA_ID=CAMNT_0017158837 /DNA_START=110 /DNA_END=343 /DNA_ORIENTATION=+